MLDGIRKRDLLWPILLAPYLLVRRAWRWVRGRE